MNELFIQENYISQGVEHVNVVTVNSGATILLEKHEWGCKLGQRHMYGHVQIKTLLGHVVDEHKGIYAKDDISYGTLFKNVIEETIPFVTTHGFYYHEKTQTLLVQDYDIVPDLTGSDIRLFVPRVRKFHILPGEQTMVLRRFNSSLSMDWETETPIDYTANINFAIPYAHKGFDTGLMVASIKGAFKEQETYENTFMLPVLTERWFNLQKLNNNGESMIDISDNVRMIMDEPFDTTLLSGTGSARKQSLYFSDINTVNIFNDTPSRKDAILFHNVKNIKTLVRA